MSIRFKRFAYAAALVATPFAGPATSSEPFTVGGLDHVLIWSRNIDQITSVMAVKLGFQVRPGGDFGDGVANRIVPFADNSYLELLYFTLPEDKLAGKPRQYFEETADGALANMFAFGTGDIEALESQLTANNWQLTPTSPKTFDPDGAGPLPPRELQWRTVGFISPPLRSADIFFIRYNRSQLNPTDLADRAVFSRHPNTAQRISAIWLLAQDADVEGERLARLGFQNAGAVELTHHGLSGYRFDSGDGTVFTLEATGSGDGAEIFKRRGPHVYGISIAVADVDQARRISEWGYGREMISYDGPLGKSFTAPTTEDLGLVVEFHKGK